MSERPISFELIVPESQRDAQVRAIEVAGGTVEDSGGIYTPVGDEARDYPEARFEPLTMIVAVGAAVFVLQAVVKMWRDRHVQGGIVVDTRGDSLRIRPVSTLPTGRLVLVESSGTRIFDKDEENAGKALLSDVLSRLPGHP
jgi:hypothetical protein